MPANQRVVVIGAGGHAKVCIDVLRDAGFVLATCIGAAGSPPSCNGVDVVIGDERLDDLIAVADNAFFVALGDNVRRQAMTERILGTGGRVVSAVSPHAVVARSVRIDDGAVVMAGAVINAEAAIGRGAIINTAAAIDHDCRIGAYAHIAPRCGLAGCVSVGERAFLGVGCSVIPGMTIGSDTIVGAGAAVISDLPAGVTAVGVPAAVRTAAGASL